VSFLPIDVPYDLAPYEEIDEKVFKKMSGKLKEPDFSSIFTPPEGERYCDSDGVCSVDFTTQTS